MVVVNFKLNKASKIALITLSAALVVFILVSVIAHGAKNKPKDGETAEQRLAFLSNYGYTCEGEAEKEITLPKEFDETYEMYNAIQIEQGYNLKHFAGQTVSVFTYKVTDYEGEDEVFAHVLVKDGRIIGGDISSARLDGFMHGIVKATAVVYAPVFQKEHYGHKD